MGTQRRFDFKSLHEGDIDPNLGKVVRTLIQRSPGWIVYLDQNQELQYAWNTDSSPQDQFSRVLTSIETIEAQCHGRLGKRSRVVLRSLLGVAVARMLEKDIENAEQAIAEARQFLAGRSTDRGRWFLAGGLISTTCLCVLVAGLVWTNRDSVARSLGV